MSLSSAAVFFFTNPGPDWYFRSVVPLRKPMRWADALPTLVPNVNDTPGAAGSRQGQDKGLSLEAKLGTDT